MSDPAGSLSASGPGGPGAFRRWLDRIVPAGRSGRALLGFPVASATFTLGVVAYLVGIFDPRSWSDLAGAAAESGAAAVVGDAIMRALFTVLVAAYNCLPPLGLAVLVVQTARRLPRGMPVVALGCLVHTAATVWLLVDMLTDDSSTSVLLLLFLPIPLGVLLVVVGGGAALLHHLRSRRRDHRERP